MLAHATVAHTGYMLLAFLATTSTGDGTPELNTLGGGLIVYFLAYTLATTTAFSVAAALGDGEPGDAAPPTYAGLAKRDPVLALALTIAMLSLLGIPTTAGFIGRLTVFIEVLEQHSPTTLWLVVLAVISTVVSAWYYLRVILVAYTSDEVEGAPLTPNPPLRFGAVLATVFTLGFGLLPNQLVVASGKAGHSLARTANPGQLGIDSPQRPGTKDNTGVHAPDAPLPSTPPHGRSR